MGRGREKEEKEREHAHTLYPWETPRLRRKIRTVLVTVIQGRKWKLGQGDRQWWHILRAKDTAKSPSGPGIRGGCREQLS